MNNTAPQLLEISEAAQVLGVSIETMRRWDREGKLKSVRLVKNGPRRYKMEEIEKFIEIEQGK